MTETKFDAAQNIKELHTQGISITKEEETALFLMYRSETNPDKKLVLKNRIIKANLRFAISESMKFKGVPGQDMSDLVAEALIGLTIAIDKFEPAKEIKFISYAVWYIDMRIKRYITDNDTIRIPGLKKAVFLKQRAAGLLPEDEEETSIFNILTGQQSLDSPVSRDEDVTETLADTIPDNSFGENMDAKSNADTVKRIIEDAIETLPSMQETVMRNYYGIGEEPMDSLKELGASIGLSTERTRQIKNAAMRSIQRNILKSTLYREFTDKK